MLARENSETRLLRLVRTRLGAFPAMVDTASMDKVVTLTERKAAEGSGGHAAATRGGGAAARTGRLCPRSWRPVSAVRVRRSRGMRYDSDVDLLVEFPPDRQAAAWNFAERACWDRRLTPDVMAAAWCTDDFLALVRPKAEVLGAERLDARGLDVQWLDARGAR